MTGILEIYIKEVTPPPAPRKAGLTFHLSPADKRPRLPACGARTKPRRRVPLKRHEEAPFELSGEGTAGDKMGRGSGKTQRQVSGKGLGDACARQAAGSQRGVLRSSQPRHVRRGLTLGKRQEGESQWLQRPGPGNGVTRSPQRPASWPRSQLRD